MASTTHTSLPISTQFLHPLLDGCDTVRRDAVNMSFRPGSRIFNNFRPFFRQPLLRRRVGTAAAPGEQSGFAKLWNSPVGPKTVHFWYVYISLQTPTNTRTFKQYTACGSPSAHPNTFTARLLTLTL